MIDPHPPDLDTIRPELDRLEEHVSAVLIAVRHNPKSMNYCETTSGHFHPEEIKALRRALSSARKKRIEASHESRTQGRGVRQRELSRNSPSTRRRKRRCQTPCRPSRVTILSLSAMRWIMSVLMS